MATTKSRTKNPIQIVKEWANKMRPFVEKHARPNMFAGGKSHERGYEESYYNSGTHVVFGNLGEFAMSAYYGCIFGGEGMPPLTRVRYSRAISPYREGIDERMNVNVASHLICPVLDWAKTNGLNASILSDRNLDVNSPGIAVYGNLPPERFEDYLKLVEQTENHIDWGLELEDRMMERPFTYVLINADKEKATPEGVLLSIYREVASVNDLCGAQFVLVSRLQLLPSLLQSPLIRNERHIEEETKKFLGKVMTPDEFVSRRKS